jgi:hypothetical protein
MELRRAAVQAAARLSFNMKFSTPLLSRELGGFHLIFRIDPTAIPGRKQIRFQSFEIVFTYTTRTHTE